MPNRAFYQEFQWEMDRKSYVINMKINWACSNSPYILIMCACHIGFFINFEEKFQQMIYLAFRYRLWLI